MISDSVLDTLFRTARTHNGWTDEPVSEETLRAIYDVMKFGPTAANGTPLRILFITTEEAKARLIPLMSEGNRVKTQAAPVVAIFAYDVEFYEKFDKLNPGRDIKGWFSGDPVMAERSAFMNSSLQVGYFIVAARAAGLDCGPMGGFSAAGVDEEFFKGTTLKSAIVCNLGHGDIEKVYPRNPRLDFDEACKIL